MLLGVSHRGELSKGHSVSKRNAVASHEGLKILVFYAIENGAFHMSAGQGIRSVQNPEGFVSLTRLFYGVQERTGIGPEPRPDVLDVVNNTVQILHLFGR